jgi:hypothetical protein
MGKPRYPVKKEQKLKKDRNGKVVRQRAAQIAAPLKLRTFLTGICALTPGGPETGAEIRVVAGPLHVVMPASTSRKSRSMPGFTIPVHLPFAVVPMRNLSPDNDRHVDFKVTDKEGNDHAIFIFSRERLSFEGLESGPLTFHQAVKAPGPKPNAQGAKDVNWIADMRRVWSDASTIRPECLPTNDDLPLPAQVAAQLTIGTGTIMTDFPAGDDTVVTFHPNKGTLVSQVITRQCVVEQDLPNVDEIKLLSTSIDTPNSPMTPIILKTVAEMDLTITIGNADLHDILAIAVKDVTPASFSVDPDFELYRDILTIPDQSDFPVPVTKGRQGSHDNCPVVRTGGG